MENSRTNLEPPREFVMAQNVRATLADKMCETSENDIESHMCCSLNTFSEQKFIIDFSDI